MFCRTKGMNGEAMRFERVTVVCTTTIRASVRFHSPSSRGVVSSMTFSSTNGRRFREPDESPNAEAERERC
jgi:hypothetical protein